MKKLIKEDNVYSLYGKLLVKESKENKALSEIEQIIKDHDEDDSWYVDKIREVINKWKKNI
jgi:chaperonin cofactor prefoldin